LQTSRGIINGPERFGIRSVRSADYLYIWNLDADTRFTNAVMRNNEWWDSWVAKAESDDSRARELVDRYQYRAPEELFDVERDPYNQQNLVDNPEFAEVKRQLRQQLEAWMDSQGDRGRATELEAHLRQWKNRDRKTEPKTKRRKAG
jgi:uncharacterized sulfatase